MHRRTLANRQRISSGSTEGGGGWGEEGANRALTPAVFIAQNKTKHSTLPAIQKTRRSMRKRLTVTNFDFFSSAGRANYIAGQNAVSLR